jgi:Domain of unknown function (DUF5615)
VSAIRIFTDEDVHGSIAAAIRRAGFDAVSTPEAGRLHESDDSQLRWAASNAYAIVTFNVGHFAGRHFEWIRCGQHHAGIVVSRQRPVGDVLRRLLHLANTLDAEAMHDRLVFLSDW